MEYTDEEKEALDFNLNRTVTVDQAVRFLLGYGEPVYYEVDGEDFEQSIIELLTHEYDRADAEHSNAKYDLVMHQRSQPKDRKTIETLQKAVEEKADALTEMEATIAKAKEYFCLIEDEIAKAMSGKESTIVIDLVKTHRSPHVHITRSSLEEWSKSLGHKITGEQEPLPEGVSWEEITIKIHANHRIAVLGPQGLHKRISFSDLGLLNKKNNEPNKQGGILIGLSQGNKFPKGNSPLSKDKTAMAKLRKSLKEILNINQDPFNEINPTDGWTPRFELIDDRNNADERAKRQASHAEYDDGKRYSFDDENDQAGEYLREHDN